MVPFQGVGFNVYAFEFDRQLSTIGAHLPSISECLIPTNDTLELPDIDSIVNIIATCSSCQYNFSKGLETIGLYSAQLHPLAMQKGIFGEQLRMSTGNADPSISTRLSDFNCESGPASSNSFPDGVYTGSNGSEIPRGIVEAEDDSFVPAEGLRQGAAEATNIALRHISLGVPWNKVVVPNVGMSGNLIQFSMIVVLEPCYPVVVEISKVFDLRYRSDAKVAAGYMYKLRNFLDIPLPIDDTLAGQESSSARISLVKYFLTKNDDFFSSRPSLEQSLRHFFYAMRTLFSCEACRKFVCFPICVKENGSYKWDLVFPNLTDYRIGFPATFELRVVFLSKVKEAAAAFHSQKVVHLDLYPSNIMWKIDPNDSKSVLIKIVDWDSVQFADRRLPDKINLRLEDTSRNRLAKALASRPDRYPHTVTNADYDDSLIEVMDHFMEDVDLQSSDKVYLDKSFRNLLEDFLTWEADQRPAII